MKRLFAALVIGAAVSSAAGVANAQAAPAPGVLDHLICYTVTDKLKPVATVDMLTELQPEFAQRQCKLLKVNKFCVPATKIVTPASSSPIVGQALQDDYVCYQVQCPEMKRPIPNKFVVDQFGQRIEEKFKPLEICAPARKAPIPCMTLGSAKQCGGGCTDPTATCHFDSALGCTCEPAQMCEGKPDKAGACGGPCPSPQICRAGLDASGKPACQCENPPPPPCGMNTGAAVCGGTCEKATDVCLQGPVGGPPCVCQPPEDSCKPDTANGQCGGPCTANPGFECRLDPASNKCRCLPPPQPCGQNPFNGQCGGDCGPNLICRFLPPPSAAPCACVTP